MRQPQADLLGLLTQLYERDDAGLRIERILVLAVAVDALFGGSYNIGDERPDAHPDVLEFR